MLSRCLQRFRWCLTAIIAVTAGPAARAADADLSPEVRELREALHAPIAANVPESAALETRRQSISDIALRLGRLVDLRDAFLLDTWRDGDADLAVAAIDGPLRAGIRARFEALSRVSLRADDDAMRLAAVSVIDETARRVRQQPLGSWDLSSLAPDLAELATASTSKTVCLQAAAALGQLESDTPTVARACTALLQSPDPQLRRRAAQTMLTLAATMHGVADGQGASHGWTVPAIARALLDILRVASLGLRDEDSIVRQECALALDQFAQAACKLSLDPRIRGAEQPSTDVNNLFRALHDETAGLTAALNDGNPDVRIRCRQALLALAVAAERWQHTIARPGSEENGPSARSGILSPGHPHSEGASGLQTSAGALAQGLVDPDVRARRAAVEALEGLGEEAQSAECGLVGALGDRDLFVRWAAMRALCRLPHLDTARAVPAIARLVRDPDLDVRIAAAKALGAIKCSRPEAIEALSSAINDREPALQVAAIQALAAIGPPARSAIPAIAQGMATPDPRVRSAAATGLAAFGSESAPYVEVLGSGTTDADQQVRRAAADALLKVAAAPNRSTAPLVTTLELVSHDRIVASAAAPPTPPAPLSATATEASVPIGPLAAAAEPPPCQPAIGPDLSNSTGVQDGPGAHGSSEPAKDAGQGMSAPVLLPSPPPPAVQAPADSPPPVNVTNSTRQPTISSAATALTAPDISAAVIRREAPLTPSLGVQPLNVAGWKPALPDRASQQVPAESVKPDMVSNPSKPIEAAFSAGGDYSQYNPPAHLPAGVIAMSTGTAQVVPQSPEPASPPASATTWQSYKPATSDSVIAVSRPLPPGSPLTSPPAYALDPSRVIAASSPYAR